MNVNASGRQWKCWRCDSLLGIEHDGVMELKYKEALYKVRGVVKATCRRCGAECRSDDDSTRVEVSPPCS
jgi:hypothetical protein